MSRSAWHAHSAFSPGISWLGPTFEYGKSSTNRRMRDTSPRNLTSTPRGIGLRLARMPHQVEVAGLALRERTRAAAARPSSSRSTATPPPRTRHADAPISGSRYAAACATCSDPPRATARSPARNGPTADSACFRLTGGLGDKSPAFRYLRTVGSLTFSLRAIDAIDSPFILRRRIDWTLGMLIITFPDLLDGKRSTIKIRPTGGRHAFA